ncbi:glycosyltransferase family 2 protein [Lentzea sp. NPDC051838]|uniref:glycosyltransferase family 2 protein n=1 Tax=Lentzea sp. NPDC051838 TaxID=3154849 RepID=UPI00342D3FC2
MSRGSGLVGLSILMVSYNAADHLGATLRSLQGAAAPSDPHEVLVTDNGSADDAADVAEDLLGTGAVERLNRNTGFAFAVNRTAERAKGDYFLLLNPDACPRPGSIDAALALLRARPQTGIVGGRCVTPDGQVDPRSCFGRITAWSLTSGMLGLSSVFRGSALFDPESLGDWQRDDDRPVDVVSGGFLLVSRETWERLGGFDETYRIYGEDQDLCLRAAAAGLQPRIAPSAEFEHAVGASSANRANRDVLVLTGRATVVRQHLKHKEYGLFAMRTGVALRALAESVLRKQPRWREVWRRRADWSGGWQARAQEMTSL